MGDCDGVTQSECRRSFPVLWFQYPYHRRIQDFVRGGGKALLAPRGAKALLVPRGEALLAPLDPRLTIWGSNFLWGGGAKAPLARPPGSAPAYQELRRTPYNIIHVTFYICSGGTQEQRYILSSGCPE